MEMREQGRKQSDGNFFTNLLLPCTTAGVFLGAALWGSLKWLKVI